MSRLCLSTLLLVIACSSNKPPLIAPDAGPADSGVNSLQGFPARDCTTSFRWPLAQSAAHVGVAGEWNHFSATADPMSDGTATGTWRATLLLPPGDYGYKFVADSNYALDPTNPVTKFVGGVENSRLVVEDCNLPLLRLDRAEVLPDKTLSLAVQLIDGASRAGIHSGSISVLLDGQPAAGNYDAPSGQLKISIAGQADGKHTFRLDAKDLSGRPARQLVVPLWIESEPFHFSDGPLYLAFVDRFRNADHSNDAPLPGVDVKVNYQGGDLAGVQAALQEGYFTSLGVRTLWLSPVYRGPAGSWPGLNGPASGYHGYWPAAPREVEPRYGGMDALKKLIAAAHSMGIRVVLDLVQRDLHQEHPYYAAHKNDGWFQGDASCICMNTGACSFDARPFDCWFAPYLPTFDYSDEAAADQLAEDAAFWLTESDADGFRIDAVKQMPHIALNTLRARVKRLEGGNARYLMLGETFTGDRAQIASYVSPGQLTGQFDFALYFAIDSALAQGQGTMADLDAAVLASEQAFAGDEMSPFLGNHDVPRFLSRANGDDLSDPFNKPPPQPNSDAPYQKLLLAQVFALTQPGIPLLYDGDEFGQPGAGDPDNRRFMRFGPDLSARESNLLTQVQKIASARSTHAGLRRGARRTLLAQGDLYVYSRGAGPDLAVIALNRGGSASTAHVVLPPDLAPPGTALHDLLGGPSYSNGNGGALDLNLGARAAAVLVR